MQEVGRGRERGGQNRGARAFRCCAAVRSRGRPRPSLPRQLSSRWVRREVRLVHTYFVRQCRLSCVLCCAIVSCSAMSELGALLRPGHWVLLAVVLVLTVLEATAKPTIYVKNDNDKLEPGMFAFERPEVAVVTRPPSAGR